MIEGRKNSLEAHFSYWIGGSGDVVVRGRGREHTQQEDHLQHHVYNLQRGRATGGDCLPGEPHNLHQGEFLQLAACTPADRADLQILVAKDIIPDPEELANCFEDALLEMKVAAAATLKDKFLFSKQFALNQSQKLVEVMGDLLCSWQFYSEIIGGKLSFDVQFALDNLKQLACAWYVLKFVQARDNTTADLTQKIEQLERGIIEDKPKIEALKEQYRRAKESAFVKQCLAETSSLKWKNAGGVPGAGLIRKNKMLF